MNISIIVATARGGVIGREGGLPWHLPAELARFKQITMGHPIIMGRKTHESISRALPGRLNIVISRNPSYKAAEGCMVVDSFSESLKAAGPASKVFVIGGETIFKSALPKADKIYLTKVDADIKGDRYFRFDPAGWQQVFSEKHPSDEKNPYPFEFTVWERSSIQK